MAGPLAAQLAAVVPAGTGCTGTFGGTGSVAWATDGLGALSPRSTVTWRGPWVMASRWPPAVTLSTGACGGPIVIRVTNSALLPRAE